MYSTRFCPYCMQGPRLLDGKGRGIHRYRGRRTTTVAPEMMQRSGRHTVPQIWIGERHVGGFDDLALLERQGQLDELLKTAP